MGGTNLEVFKFGIYLMFPIGIMYYFGTNLDERFAVPGFWPKAEHSHKIPFEREDIKNEYLRLTLRQRQFEKMKQEREALQAAREQQQQPQQNNDAAS